MKQELDKFKPVALQNNRTSSVKEIYGDRNVMHLIQGLQ